MIDFFQLPCQIAPPAGAKGKQLQRFPFTHSATQYDAVTASFHLAVSSLRNIDVRVCTNSKDGPHANFFPSDQDMRSGNFVFSKMLRKSDVQFNDIYWAIWDKIHQSIGDLDRIIREEVQDGDGADKFVKTKTLRIALSANEQGLNEAEDRRILCPQILGLVDQLLCVACYGNVEMLRDRCPEKDQAGMFEGAGKRAYKARDQFLKAWKEHMFSNGSKKGDTSVNGKSAYDSDDDEEVENEGGSDAQSGMQDEDCLIGRDGAQLTSQLLWQIATIVAPRGPRHPPRGPRHPPRQPRHPPRQPRVPKVQRATRPPRVHRPTCMTYLPR